MAKPVNYNALSDEELEQANYELQRQKDAIREQQLALKAVVNQRASDAKVAAVLDGLSDTEREVLVQAVAATGAGNAVTPGGEK